MRLSSQNFVSDRPGQIVIGAVNGVGINTAPSGDFALEVYGGIRSTDPSPIGVSDERLKENITDADTAGCLQSLLSLDLKDFKYKEGVRSAIFLCLGGWYS